MEASEEVSVDADAAICYVRSGEHISSRREQRETVKAFLDGQNVGASSPDWLQQHIVWFLQSSVFMKILLLKEFNVFKVLKKNIFSFLS